LSQVEELSGETYLFVDLETGGLVPERHSILQLAAVLTDQNLKIQGYFMSYVRPHPDLEVTAEALAINQLRLEDLGSAPSEALVAQALNNFANLAVGKPRFAGYNCKFDLLFLDEMWRRQSTTVPPYKAPWLDVLDVARIKLELDSALVNFKLATIAQHFGVDSSGAHDAGADLMITIQVAKQLKTMPARNGAVVFETAKFSQ
jgi:DNA polymerase III subunit epsilon